MISRIPRVAIVVLTWNDAESTCRCVESLLQLDYPHYDIVVVDNGSTDHSPEILRQRFLQIQVLALERNLGFTGGMNHGIQWALAHGAELVLILNNDTMVAPDLLTRLAEAVATNPAAGLLACEVRSQSAPHELEPVLTGFDWWRGVPRRAQWRASNAQPLEMGLVSATALLATRAAIERVGLLEERYFIYFEDLDWAVRVQRAGFKCLFVPGAIVWHHSGAATWGPREAPRTQVYYYYPRNNILFVRAHGSRLAQLTFIPFIVGRTVQTAVGIVLGGVVKRKPNVGSRLRALGAGFVDGWLGRSGPHPRYS